MVDIRPMALVGKKNPVLLSPAEKVGHRIYGGKPDKELHLLALRMRETLKRHPGIALAAPQVGQPYCMVVTSSDYLWIDPEIVDVSEAVNTEPEGCLSLPHRLFAVERPNKVTVTFLSVNGEVVFEEVEGLAARMVCHEVDHLEGRILEGRFEEIR